ncbi:MAG: hypothetical protein QM778_16910 [Myxococcales bacterium]
MEARWIALLALAVACGDGGGQGPGGNEESSFARQGCIETTSAVTPDATTLEGKDAQALLDLASGERKAQIQWRDGSSTELAVSTSQVKVVKVKSRQDPKFTLDVPVHCDDRLRVESRLSVKTTDGRVDEQFPHVAFEGGCGEGGSLSTYVHLKTSELHGDYVRQGTEDGKLSAVYFGLNLGSDAFSGSISEEFTTGSAVGMGPTVATWDVRSFDPSDLPLLTLEACQAAGGIALADPGDGRLLDAGCGPGREALGTIDGFIEGGLCCELSAKFCWGQAVTIDGRCAPSPARFYRESGTCKAQTSCTCEGPDCARSFATMEACETEYAGCEQIEYKRCGGLEGGPCGADEYCAYMPGWSCGSADATAVCLPRPEGCDDIYLPVCGCNNQQYANLCEANAAGQGVRSLSACDTN